MLLKYIDDWAIRWVLRRRIAGRIPPQIGTPGLAISGNMMATVYRHCIVVCCPGVPADKIRLTVMRNSMVLKAETPIRDALELEAAHEEIMARGRR